MHVETLYEMRSGYREPLAIKAYHFGGKEKTTCIVGSTRGNEIQQLYICSQLIRRLTALEAKGMVSERHGITVIPSLNHYSMNIGKRFWAMDNSDINRMFPGYDKGETTQRIAAGVFERLQGYKYGLQFISFYLSGDFVPHVRMMDTSYQSTQLASLFGLPYVVVRKPSPYDTATLNFNWQVWETDSFSLYSDCTDRINEQSAELAVTSVMRFLSRMHMVKLQVHGGFDSTIFSEAELRFVRAERGGIYRPLKTIGQTVDKDEPIAEILHPYEGTVLQTVTAPEPGVIFFAARAPLVMQHTPLFKLIAGLVA